MTYTKSPADKWGDFLYNTLRSRENKLAAYAIQKLEQLSEKMHNFLFPLL